MRQETHRLRIPNGVGELIRKMHPHLKIKIKVSLRTILDDVKILGLSEMAKRDYIITGDADLLVLKEHHAVPIITLRKFWEISKGKSKRKKAKPLTFQAHR